MLNQTRQPESSRADSATSRLGLSRRRLAVVAAVSGVCFAAGFYLGVYVLFGLAGSGDLHGWLFLIVTVPLGGLLSGLGAATVGPSTRTVLGPTVASSLITAAVVTAGLVLVGAGFGLALSVGGVLSPVAATVAVSAASRRRNLVPGLG